MAVCIGCCVFASMLDSFAIAQTIELTREIAPPALPSPSLAATVVGVLENEATQFNAQAGEASSDLLRTALQARANLRLLAAELLASGDRAADSGSLDFVRGMKLAVNRETLDRMIDLAMTANDDVQINIGAAAAIESFNRGYADHLLRGGEADAGAGANRTESWLAPLLSRLLPTVIEDASKPLATHWIEPLRAAGTPVPGIRDQAALIEALRARAAASTLDETTKANLAGIIEFLDRGRQFADLAAKVDEHRHVIDGLLDCADAITAATWLREEERTAMLAEVADTIGAFRDPETRDAAIANARRSDHLTRVLVAATALERDSVEAKDLREIIAAMQAAADDAKDARDAARAMTLAAISLERMLQVRAIATEKAPGLTRELRTIERDLLKEYRTVEGKVLKELATGTIYRGSLADPGLASLLSDHRERVEDIQRLRHLPEWSAAINRIHPPAAKDFDIQMRKRAGDLLVPTKRPEARLALDRFETELAMFDAMPFEGSLQQSSPAAGQLTGALHAQLAATLTAKRRSWADDWSRSQQTVEPSQAMTLLHRLFSALRDAASLIEIRGDVLNRWPAWQLSEAALEAGQSDVQTRLRLACAAAVQEQMDLVSLREQIDRIDAESPVARLAGRLMSLLGSQLRESDDGAAGVLAQLIIQPRAEAMLLKHRVDLARLCRYAAEAAHARDSGKAEAANECDEYVNALARRLLGAVGSP